MSYSQDTETLKKIEQKLDKLQKKTVGKRFIIIIVAVISGLFTLFGVLFEAYLAPRTEYGIHLARIAASETGKFYIDVINIVMEVDGAVNNICDSTIGSQEGPKGEMTNALNGLWEIIRTPPSTTNELIVKLANDYNEFVAKNIGVGTTSNGDGNSDCKRVGPMTTKLRRAIDKEIRGSPLWE